MELIDYSLERFPDGMFESLDDLQLADDVEFALPDLAAEDQAHRTNVMITEWIEKLAVSSSESHPHFLPDHSCVGLHDVQLEGDVQTSKFEVGFFRRSDLEHTVIPPSPFLTLYSWRVEQLGFGIIWISLGFRCEPITPEAEEAIYQQVLAAATRGSDSAS